MGALERLVQEDSVTGASEAVAELDVLDGRARKAFRIEAADLQEYRASDRPAPRPNRRSVGVSMLVDEVVQEIPVLRHDALGPRLGIIGAEDGGQVWMRSEQLDDALHGGRGDDDVSIDKEENVASSLA